MDLLNNSPINKEVVDLQRCNRIIDLRDVDRKNLNEALI